ncbi:MAG: hypothetical protein EOO11_15440 [Chitinophagaceae bacterium]|nr:MAG: hypothetical protein EOO11_15440 [Chitinophagaceae bacterium]
MRLLLLLSFLCAATCGCAQQFTERVYLTDSSTVYEGLIIEQAPSKYIKILRRREKDTVTVPLNLVLKLTKEYPRPDSTAPAPPKPKAGGRVQAAYLELLGPGLLNSLHYDTRLVAGRRDGWGVRAGIGYWKVPTISHYNDTLKQGLISIPLMVNYLVGSRRGFLELGLGITYFLTKPERAYEGPKDQYTVQELGMRLPTVLGSFLLGYRHVPLKKGFTWGVALSALVGKRLSVPSAGLDLPFIPSLAFKLGYRFG